MATLNFPDIPASPMFIGEENKVMTIEWQEFFRGLFDRVGGTTAPTLIESDLSTVTELYKTEKDDTKRIDDLEKIIKTLVAPKSYDKEIANIELIVKSIPSQLKSVYPSFSSTDNAVVRWDGSLGTKIQDSFVIIDDLGGVKTIGGRIRNTTRIDNGDSPYTVLVTDHVVYCDTDGGAITVNLPAGIEGTHYKLINCGSSGNDLTVSPN